MAERSPMTFPAQGHPSCSWRGRPRHLLDGTGRRLFLSIPSRDLRSSRGGRERGPAALQSRAMGRGHAAAHRSPGSQPGASGRTFDRGYHCASTRGRSFDRVASLVLGATWARLDARLRKLFVFRKQALYEQVGFDRRSASWHTPQEIAAARIDALLTYDTGERLRSIRNPTLLIAAADDLLVPWQLSELIAEEIAHACLVKLDHGGHRFPQTRVEAYNTLLLEFFRDVPDAGRIHR